MAKAGKKFSNIGNKYGRPDLERLGIFSELNGLSGRYVSPFPKPASFKGKNMIPGGPKIKVGTQDCYFDKDPPPSKFKNVSERPFMPPGDTKLHGCPGDHYGTFGGIIEAFSNKRKPVPPYKKQPGNFVTNPGKKGGPGYTNICINPYPTHSVDRYGLKPKYKDYGKVLDGPLVSAHYPTAYFDPDVYRDYDKLKPGPTYVRPNEKEIPMLPPGKLIPTGPAKWLGGCKAGCFDKFPEHKPDKYLTLFEIMKPKKSKNLSGNFYPQSHALKSYYTSSVINENTDFKCNATNYKSYEPSFIKHLVD